MKKTEKIRYEIDPHNRLIYEKRGGKSEVPLFRTVLDGKFEIDKNNQITYHVKKAQGPDIPRFGRAQRGEPVEPQQLKLKGKWALDDEHNLVLTLDKWGSQIAGNKLTIESELIGAKDNMLSFALTTKDSKNNTHIYIVRISGKWQTDEYNRFTFNIQKETGITDKITLTGAWEINKRNEIIYTYEKFSCGGPFDFAQGKLRQTMPWKKEKTTKVVAFRGYWDIAGKHRIIYVLNKEIGSEFDFRVSAGKPAARGLEYELGVGAAPSKKTITLFGEWKIRKNSGVLFEMPCAEGKIRSVILGGWARLEKNHKLEIRLQNKTGEDLGIDVKLSRSILDDDGEAFIRALKSRKEVSIAAGIGFRW